VIRIHKRWKIVNIRQQFLWTSCRHRCIVGTIFARGTAHNIHADSYSNFFNNFISDKMTYSTPTGIKVKLSLYLIKHHAMKTYRGPEV
jgi:hypothetical protein